MKVLIMLIFGIINLQAFWFFSPLGFLQFRLLPTSRMLYLNKLLRVLKEVVVKHEIFFIDHWNWLKDKGLKVSKEKI